jgi:hypothetical protein
MKHPGTGAGIVTVAGNVEFISGVQLEGSINESCYGTK